MSDAQLIARRVRVDQSSLEQDLVEILEPRYTRLRQTGTFNLGDRD